jgi:hypothetical protein
MSQLSPPTGYRPISSQPGCKPIGLQNSAYTIGTSAKCAEKSFDSERWLWRSADRST